MDAHERSRHSRLVNIRSFRSYDGLPVKEVKDVLGADGRALASSPAKPPLGPFTAHGERKIEAPVDAGALR